MRIIEPIEIVDSMVGSAAGTVPEGDYAVFALGTTYAVGDRVIVQAGKDSFAELLEDVVSAGSVVAICITSKRTIYVATNGASGKIYWKKEFADIYTAVPNAISGSYAGICEAPNGDVYASVNQAGTGTGQIYIQAGGEGDFVSLAQTNRDWWGLCANSSGDIFCTVYAGDIYKRTAGAGDFAATTAGNKNWMGICEAPNGDMYAAVYNGDVWVQTGGAGAWAAVAGTDRYWTGVIARSNGDIYACSESDGGGTDYVYKRTAGAGAFAALTTPKVAWCCLAVDTTNDDLYGGKTAADIYRSEFAGVHKIYESLIAGNVGNYPPADVLKTTPKWLEISATNKWKVFDGKVVDQMSTPSPATYTITPGEAFNSVVLLNVEATSVTIAVDTTPAYSQTVATGATDIVKMDIAGLSTNIITITITNSAGLAKCGEIVVGSYYELGTLRPYPNVGIIDYSIKEQDEWGNWSITERAYSEKMNADVNVTYSSLDAVIAKLKDYRATPVVWIGSSSYSCLIVYGFVKDWSVPVSTRGKSILSLQIEGLT